MKTKDLPNGRKLVVMKSSCVNQTTKFLQYIWNYRSIKNLHPLSSCVMLSTACSLVGAVHVGVVQSPLSHALYRVRTLSAPEYHGRLADNNQHAVRSVLLRTLCWTLDHANSELRYL